MVPAISGNLAPSTVWKPGAVRRSEAFSKRGRFSARAGYREEIRRGRGRAGAEARALRAKLVGGLVAFLRFYQAELLQVAAKAWLCGLRGVFCLPPARAAALPGWQSAHPTPGGGFDRDEMSCACSWRIEGTFPSAV